MPFQIEILIGVLSTPTCSGNDLLLQTVTTPLEPHRHSLPKQMGVLFIIHKAVLYIGNSLSHAGVPCTPACSGNQTLCLQQCGHLTTTQPFGTRTSVTQGFWEPLACSGHLSH